MIKTLLKLRFSSFIHALTRTGRRSTQQNTNGTGRIVLYIILYAYVAVVFAFMFGTALLAFGSLSFASGNEWLFFSMYVLLAFLLMFIGSVFTTKSQLFEAKDNEMLLTLPIRPRDIFISRMASVLLLNFVFEMMVAIPAGIIWGMYGNGGILSWVFFLITTLALPFFSFALSGVFAWLLSLLNAKIKNSTWVTTGLYLVFFMGYFYLISGMQDYLELFVMNGTDITAILQNIAPVYWFGSAIGNENVWHLLLSLLIYLVPFVIAYVVLSRSFMKICLIKPREKKVKHGKNTKGKSHSMRTALLLREFKRLSSSSTYLLNAGLGVPLAIIAVAFVAIKRNDLFLLFGEFSAEIGNFFGFIMILALCVLNGTCLFTAPSVSLEGKNYGLLRSLPIPTEELLRAKLMMHYSIMSVTDLICSVIVLIAFPLSLPVALAVLIVPQLYSVWVANIGLVCGVCHPMLDWTNEAVAVKQGTAVMLTMLFGSLPAIVLGIGALVLSFVSPWLSLFALCAVIVTGDVLSYRYLMRGGVKRFESIG